MESLGLKLLIFYCFFFFFTHQVIKLILAGNRPSVVIKLKSLSSGVYILEEKEINNHRQINKMQSGKCFNLKEREQNLWDHD